jgi:hypothetical protein
MSAVSLPPKLSIPTQTPTSDSNELISSSPMPPKLTMGTAQALPTQTLPTRTNLNNHMPVPPKLTTDTVQTLTPTTNSNNHVPSSHVLPKFTMGTALSVRTPTTESASTVPINTAQTIPALTSTDSAQKASAPPYGTTVVESKEERDRKLRFALTLLKEGYSYRKAAEQSRVPISTLHK